MVVEVFQVVSEVVTLQLAACCMIREKMRRVERSPAAAAIIIIMDVYSTQIQFGPSVSKKRV